ncbi:phosphohydrolase [Archaeoglobales archaeon]|nr:MAG: phosphohydrolase [Archaeoglobales archaeon]
MNKVDELVKFIHEAGSLKNIPRSGWLKIGIKDPESVAEHSFRVALIAFFIAYMESKNLERAYKASFYALIHDIPESRTLDLHKLSKRYVNVNRDVLKQQLGFSPELFDELNKTINEVKDFVEDADKLELLFQAKEYSEFTDSAMDYTKNLEFRTETAKKIAEVCVKSDHRWWIEFE